MSRFLFVVPQFTGHVNPAVSVAMELAERGHDVAWVTPGRSRPFLPEDAVVFEMDDVLVEELRATYAENAGRGRGLPNDFRCLWDDIVLPLARGTLATVESAIDDYRPSMLVVDQYALAGGLAARRRGLVWATLVPTAFLQVDEALADLPGVRDWLDVRLVELQSQAGLEPGPMPDRSPHLVIAFSVPALAGEAARVPAHYHFVGPAFEHRSALPSGGNDFPWDELRERPRVLVTVGSWTTYRRKRFLGAVVEALAALPLQAIVIAPPEDLPPANNVLAVRPYVNNLALYPHVDAVLCHGGHGTVYEALAHGLPLVLAPVSYDHPLVTQQVVEAGAGLRVKAVRTSVAEVREATEAILADAGYRVQAERIGASLKAAGGGLAAADLLEELVGGSRDPEVA